MLNFEFPTFYVRIEIMKYEAILLVKYAGPDLV